MLVIELQNDLCAGARAEKRGLSGALARAVRDRGVLQKLAPVLGACRARAVPVIYLTKERHPAIPPPENGPSIYRRAGSEPSLVHGTWGAQVVDEIKPQEGDLVLPRFTSIDPSYGTELWAICESMRLSTLVLAGSDANRGPFAPVAMARPLYTAPLAAVGLLELSTAMVP